MKLSLTLLFLQLWGNVELTLSQNACSRLPDVPHAHVSEETKKAEYQEGDVIHFTCESGYKSDHISKYVCTGAGWQVVRRGMCYSCSVLPDVPHAHVTDETRKAEYQEGDVIHFTCEPGYTSDVTIKYVCASEGWLAVRQGLCHYPCQVGKMHPRLFVAGLPPPNDRIKNGHKLQFQCSNDLTLDGSKEIECLETGQWSSPFPTCSVITCEVGALHLGLTVTGMLSASETVQVGVKLQFDCSGEFQLDGSNETECLPTGKWSAPIPTCSDKCEVSGLPDNVVVTPLVSGHYLTKGETLTFSCSLNGQFIQGKATVECLASGEWSDPFPTCGEVKCTAPLIEHGMVLGDIQEYKENQVLNYQCDLQYKRVEERQSKCIIVGTRVEWSPTPACESIKCEVKLPALEGTRYEPAFRSLFLPGDTLRVFCGEKHWIVDHQTTTAETTCQSDGQWSIRPLCQEVICSNQRDQHVSSWDVYSYDRKKLGDSVYYRCRYGYQSTSSNNQANCTRDGWAPKPLCQAPATCGKPPSLENGDTKNTVDILYRHGARVEYICQNLYQMEGGPYKTCNNGEWIGQMRCLKPCTVVKDVMTRHNIRFTYSYEEKLYAPHNEVISFSCTYGTRPVGTVGMRPKCVDGVMNFPTCV